MDWESSCCIFQDSQHRNCCGSEGGQKSISEARLETIRGKSRKRKDDILLKLLELSSLVWKKLRTHMKIIYQLRLQKLTFKEEKDCC